jgi:hypothetical protein
MMTARLLGLYVVMMPGSRVLAGHMRVTTQTVQGSLTATGAHGPTSTCV